MLKPVSYISPFKLKNYFFSKKYFYGFPSIELYHLSRLENLGNVLQSDNSMTIIDCDKKRAILILKIHSTNHDFYFNNPDVIF